MSASEPLAAWAFIQGEPQIEFDIVERATAATIGKLDPPEVDAHVRPPLFKRGVEVSVLPATLDSVTLWTAFPSPSNVSVSIDVPVDSVRTTSPLSPLER